MERGKLRKTPLRMVRDALELEAERVLRPPAFTGINQRFLRNLIYEIRIAS